ncbi:MAG: cytochrome c [Terriglobia bacterium]|nr:cytochrome c [Terriglobia bacterium]
MKTCLLIAMSLALACCARTKPESAPQPKAFGTAITIVSGDKQLGTTGTALPQSLVVQINDAEGNAVTGAPVSIQGANGASATPAVGLTDDSGQFTSTISMGETSGRYRITATSHDRAGKPLTIQTEEIALGYQQTWGRELSATYCDRCHNPESTPERVSNYDNLSTKPHPFTEGAALNKLSDADLTAIITHGGPALNNSPEMPPYGYTLSNVEIQALIAYIRTLADPPYQDAKRSMPTSLPSQRS